MKLETLTESQEARVALSTEEVEALHGIGTRLASKSAWWGQAEPSGDRTVIQLRPLSQGIWTMRVVDAVGVICVGSSLQIVVLPKIPTVHFLYLLSMSGHFPRLDPVPGHMSHGDSLWNLVAAWFIHATEHLLRRELTRDYLPAEMELQTVRGQLAPIRTAQAFYAGRIEFHCEFAEFDFNTPLNRIIKAATKEVASSPVLQWELRRRALRILARLAEVGDLVEGDLRVQPDRHTTHYGDAWILGVHVLRTTGRTIAHGAERAWTFLLRTPELVEDGVRGLLTAQLGPRRVQKRGLQLTGTTLTFNPDLLFDSGRAVADVKYRLSRGPWNRPDLYQIVAFAEAFQTKHGAIVQFRSSETEPTSTVHIGQKRIANITGTADENRHPAEEAARLVASTQAWLNSCDP